MIYDETRCPTPTELLEKRINSVQWVQLLRDKDPNTYEHCVRVAILSEKLGDALDLLPTVKIQLMLGCFLHDLGKMLIPDNILHNRELLTPDEWSIMKLHPQMGADILHLDSGVNDKTIEVVRYHHERWDGHGYPYGLAGERIPFLGRVCSVIDAFDSMITDRPYRKRMSLEEARKELIDNSGTQFDAYIVEKFLSLQESYTTFYGSRESV
jgi:putative nucleotidyltransferase with HDIG domain